MTNQAEDKIICDGCSYTIRNELMLEEYIREHFSIPPINIYSTDCHRGYFATFEIKKGKLFLIELNHQNIDRSVCYTGTINLIDGYTVVEQETEFSSFIIEDNRVLKIWFKDGVVMREEKQKNI